MNEHANQRSPEHKQNAKAPLQRPRRCSRPIRVRNLQTASLSSKSFCFFFQKEVLFFFEKAFST
jgi:hypothetical protein